MALLGINVPPRMQDVLNAEAARQGAIPPAYAGFWADHREGVQEDTMAQRNAVEPYDAAAASHPAVFEISQGQVDLIRQTIMPNANDLQFQLFLNLCRVKRLDPLTKQIYAVYIKGQWQFFASIDGLRVIAERSGNYGGQTAPYWCGPDGVWRDVWLEKDPPSAAKVGVWKRGYSEPTWGVATFKSYGAGKVNNWVSMPEVMLSKCAEALALRKAFPDDLSGLYVRDEWPDEEPVTSQPRHRPVERVNRDTGEITAVTHEIVEMSTPELHAEITRLGTELGWQKRDISAEAKRESLDLNVRVGAIAMLQRMQAMVSSENAAPANQDDPDASDVQDAEFTPLAMDDMPEADPDFDKYL